MQEHMPNHILLDDPIPDPIPVPIPSQTILSDDLTLPVPTAPNIVPAERQKQRELPAKQRESPAPSSVDRGSRPKRERKVVDRLNIQQTNTKSYKAKTSSIKKYVAMTCALMTTSSVTAIATAVIGNEAAFKAYDSFDTATSTFDDCTRSGTGPIRLARARSS